MKKTKLYKSSLFLLGLLFLVNFGFCLMPLTVSAQISNEPKEIIPEILQEDINFSELLSISTEARQKLSKIKPANIGQAGRISGVSPSDVNILSLIHI